MSWVGALIGSYIGGALFKRGGFAVSLLGSVLGAFVGHSVEKKLFGNATKARPGGYASMSEQERATAFCASVAAMLAKMAKADGHVSPDEIASVEAAFRRLGFTPAARAYAINVFRQAKDDRRSIYEYAQSFATVVDSVEVRELFYEILWDLARTDGRVTAEELAILARIPRALRIRPDWFAYFAYGRGGGSRGETGGHSAAPDELSAAYAVLGVPTSVSDEELKRRYRDLAKKNHPDALRAQGLPEAMVGKATERMSRINAAWETVKRARNLV